MPGIQLKLLKSKKKKKIKKKNIYIANMLRKKRKCMHIKRSIQTKKGRKSIEDEEMKKKKSRGICPPS